MKFIIILVFSLFSFTLKAETSSVTAAVKSFRLDADQKHYRVILKGKQVTYKAEENSLSCLESSLESKKEVKLAVDGIMITDCKKI
jgi:flagellar motor component MotA